MLFFVLAVVVPVLALTLTVTLDRPPAGDLDRRLPVLLALLTVAFCAVATLLGALLARLVSEPLRELVEQAHAIARGDFASPPSAIRSTGEVGELARAFDRMRVELAAYLAAVRSSRDELTQATARLGQTLSSTHDLPRLLAVVLEAAVRSRKGRAGPGLGAVAHPAARLGRPRRLSTGRTARLAGTPPRRDPSGSQRPGSSFSSIPSSGLPPT